MNIKIFINGFGCVGRALAKIIVEKRDVIEKKYGLRIEVVAIKDSRGAVFSSEGLDINDLLKLIEYPRSSIGLYEPYGKMDIGLDEIYDQCSPDIHVELTPSNYDGGEPGISNVLYALKRGANVVLANKAALVYKFREIMSIARKKGLVVKYKATVMGGTPFIDILLSLKTIHVSRIYGILNATTNYVLTYMHRHLVDLDEALENAKSIGIAEKNPIYDIEGIDAAAKLVIISNTLGIPLGINDVMRTSLRNVSLKDIVDALRKGEVIKYIAWIDFEEQLAEVAPRRIESNNMLADIDGLMNAVVIEHEYGNIFFSGKGGGCRETASMVLEDILSASMRGV